MTVELICANCKKTGISVIVGDGRDRRFYCSMSCKIAHEALLAGAYAEAQRRIAELEQELAAERNVTRALSQSFKVDIEYSLPPAGRGCLDTTNEPWQFPKIDDATVVPLSVAIAWGKVILERDTLRAQLAEAELKWAGYLEDNNRLRANLAACEQERDKAKPEPCDDWLAECEARLSEWMPGYELREWVRTYGESLIAAAKAAAILREQIACGELVPRG